MSFNMYTFNKRWDVVTLEEVEAKLNEPRAEIKGATESRRTDYISRWLEYR
jgi:UDP-galactopyranose mutase